MQTIQQVYKLDGQELENQDNPRQTSVRHTETFQSTEAHKSHVGEEMDHDRHPNTSWAHRK